MGDDMDFEEHPKRVRLRSVSLSTLPADDGYLSQYTSRDCSRDTLRNADLTSASARRLDADCASSVLQEALALRDCAQSAPLLTPEPAGDRPGEEDGALGAQGEGTPALGEGSVGSLWSRKSGAEKKTPKHRWWKNVRRLQTWVIISTLLLVAAVVTIGVLWHKGSEGVCMEDSRLVQNGEGKGMEKPSCSDGWLMDGQTCYFFSTERKYWNASQMFCTSHGATLAMLKDTQTLETINRLKGSEDYWLGLRKGEGQGWYWEDGTPFNNTINAMMMSLFYLLKHGFDYYTALTTTLRVETRVG
ncbi:C-type lectin domain family 2 member L-like isoform X2 [Ambystoma mexicanum]|uniref:C-type lectin domain family 2 member L-like isoform X2 n=1 Tax=Ambystoma mexicanum TaxID=8296 RepID=UPI0037E7D884